MFRVSMAQQQGVHSYKIYGLIILSSTDRTGEKEDLFFILEMIK